MARGHHLCHDTRRPGNLQRSSSALHLTPPLLGLALLCTLLSTPLAASAQQLAVCGDGVIDAPEQCDDGNTADGDCCTADCSFEPSGAACDDADACTTGESCDGAGACTGTPVDCDDGLFCNGVETCDPATGCVAGASPLDDGVACTIDRCNEATDEVSHDPDDLFCNDGAFCNGLERCDATLGCLMGTPPSLDDGVRCTDDFCDEGGDVIVHIPSDANCDDGNFCNGLESCDDTLDCQPGTPPPTDDGVRCTVDGCDEINDVVTNIPDDTACDDALFCNGTEFCDATLDCQPGTPPQIDDGVGCTFDECDEVTDVVTNTPDDSICDDLAFCNGTEFCDPLLDCQDGSPPRLDDGVTCTEDICDEDGDQVVHTPLDSRCIDTVFCDGVERCDPALDCVEGEPIPIDDGITCTVDECDEQNDVILHRPNDGLCDDGQFCTGVELCDPDFDCQTGTPPQTDDGVGCTVDRCDEINDVVTNIPDDRACDDALFCNGAEFCDATLDCQPGIPPQIDDGVGCTLDQCDEDNDLVTHTADDSICDDLAFCNGVEFCDPVLDCRTGTPPTLDDGIDCTEDVCDEAGDQILHNPLDSRCIDTVFCDGIESCDPVLDCVEGDPVPIDDGISCTVDECDEENDIVLHLPNDGLCDDGLFCTGVELCDPNLDCQPGTPPQTDDGIECTVDECDEIDDVVTNRPDDTLCDDGQFCNGAELCDAALDCQPGTPPQTDDGVQCTVDDCDETSDVVTNTPDDANCDDGLFCNGAEFCDATLDCQAGARPETNDGVACTRDACVEETDTVTHTVDDSLCDDALFCNGAEFCDATAGCQAGTPPEIDDGVGCTRDACVEETDTVTHTPDDSLCDDALFCNGAEFCDATADCQAGAAPETNDGVDCTRDTCIEETDTVLHTPDDSLCDDGIFCDGAEFCDASVGCQAGTPPQRDDGVPCTRDACIEETDTVTHTPDDSLCDDALFCNGAEFCDATLDCQAGTPPEINDGIACTRDACVEETDSVTHTPDDSLCDDALFCNGAEFCDTNLDCQAGTPPQTDDGIACTRDACIEETDTITHTADDSFCDNGLFCDGVESCDLAADCQSGTPPVLTDGVECTDDVCDEDNDQILHNPIDSRCVDTVFCDGVESCDIVLDCIEGVPPPEDDGILCTIDFCDEDIDQVTHTPDDSVCDDALFCNGAEFCDAALDCQSGIPPQTDDGVDCTRDACNEETDTVTHAPDDSLCDDALFCNGVESCDAALDCQSGIPPQTDDGVDCTVDACNEETDTVTHTPDDSFCDDGQFCTGVEVCELDLGCQPGTPPPTDDGVGCTRDACVEDTASIIHLPDDSLCDDALFCNGSEFCDVTLDCQAGTPPQIDDGVDCTRDACIEETDTIIHKPDDSLCDDGLFCTGVEVCDLELDCQAGTPRETDDGVDCTRDACSEELHSVTHTPDDSLCDDGLFCTGVEVCDPDFDCLAGTPPQTDDGVACTVDECDEINDVVTNRPDDTFCDDGQFCNGAELCDAALDCQPGTPPQTDDGIECTVDECDEANDVVTNRPDDTFCDDGQFCNGVESCDPQNDCQPGTEPSEDDGVPCTDEVCQEETDTILHVANDANCDDGLFCNGMETCDAVDDCQAGMAPEVDDGVDCTADRCDEDGDVVVHDPDPAVCSDGVFCNGAEICDPAQGCIPAPPESCDDRVDCTQDRCDPLLDACLNIPIDGLCDNGTLCDGTEFCDLQQGCVSPGNEPEGMPCETDSVDCTQDACDGAGSCVHSPDDGACSDGIFCNGVEICDAVLDCRTARPPCLASECNEDLEVCPFTVLSLGEGQCVPGSTCRIPVVLHPGLGVGVGETANDLFFDGTLLELTALEPGPNTLARNGECIESAGGMPGDPLRVACLTDDPNFFTVPYGSGVVATAVFRCLSAPVGSDVPIGNIPSAATAEILSQPVEPIGGLDGRCRILACRLPGDVNDDGSVDGPELRNCTLMFLEMLPPSPCADRDGDGRVAIFELSNCLAASLGLFVP